jgi:hypothetical protein
VSIDPQAVRSIVRRNALKEKRRDLLYQFIYGDRPFFLFSQMSPPGLTPQPGSPTPTSESGNQSPPTNVDREEVE